MKSVNRVTLLGNITRDAELKTTAGGQSVCTFGLATNRVWKDQSGERQSLPEYHTLVCWGRLAEHCAQYLKKGKPLYVEGYLKTHSWDGLQAGVQGGAHKMFRTEVIVENLSFVSPKDASATLSVETGNEETEPLLEAEVA